MSFDNSERTWLAGHHEAGALAYDDDHTPTAPVEPEVYCEPEDLDAESAIRHETLAAVLQFLTGKKARAKKVGARVLLLNYLLGRSDCRTQKALAVRLGVKEARCSQALEAISVEFEKLTGRQPSRSRKKVKSGA